MKSCDHIRMSKSKVKNSRCLCETDSSSPALPNPDSIAPEHSYSQSPGLSDTADISTQNDPTVNLSESHVSPTGIMKDQTDFGLPSTHFGPSHLGSTQLSPTQLSPTFLHSSSQPSLDPDQADPTLFDALGMVGEVSELELPLGHEEVAGEEVWLNGMSPPKKSKRGRSRGWGKGGVKRSPTPVATFCCLDDPHGPGGLLASRLSQPVFHTGPEIVYIETSALPAHTVKTSD